MEDARMAGDGAPGASPFSAEVDSLPSRTRVPEAERWTTAEGATASVESLLRHRGYHPRRQSASLDGGTDPRHRVRSYPWRQWLSRGMLRCMCSAGKQLEVASFIYALALLALLTTLHLSYVNRCGCASALLAQVPESQRTGHAPVHFIRAYDIVELRVPPARHWAASEQHAPAWRHWLLQRLLPRVQRYQFATEKGLLLLSEDARRAHNVSMLRLTLPAHHLCFGSSPLLRSVMELFVGSETVALNAFAYLLRDEPMPDGRTRRPHPGADGYVLNVHSGDMYNIGRVFIGELYARTAHFTDIVLLKLGVLLTSVYVMFTISALIAFALREVQARITKLAVEIQHARHRTPYAGALFSSSMHALVLVPIITGILFFLFEFFDNQLLAFCVLVLAWLAEVVVMLTWRSGIPAYVLPRAFAAYMLAFHLYFFSFPLGFSWLALFTCAAFMQHTMFLVLSRHERHLTNAGGRNETRPQEGTGEVAAGHGGSGAPLPPSMATMPAAPFGAALPMIPDMIR
ncbi:hypothetical protein CDCA_CDCA09G2612 [Cyanidium caldarium]|uniref:Membralin n=1 Tax=Cyanidium caldarium TaxID=2771 RepID=A0AAV9IWE8_CYACA|nr:hypothetical protein CDCA_CDCA09G2612 [Cyanidium caldarium]